MTQISIFPLTRGKRFFKAGTSTTFALLLTALLTLAAIVTQPVNANTRYNSIAFMGDSNLWLGGDDCSSESAWSRMVVDSLGIANARSFARSGATWTNTENTRVCAPCYSEVLDDNNVIYNQWVRMIDAVADGSMRIPEVIVISAGTNDAWFASKRKDMYSADVTEVFSERTPIGGVPSSMTSLAGSVRLLCEGMRKAFPMTRIVLLTPPYNTKVSRDEIRRVADVITQCCMMMRLECIPLHDDGIVDPDAETLAPIATRDGVHLSPHGARRVADRVITALRQ